MVGYTRLLTVGIKKQMDLALLEVKPKTLGDGLDIGNQRKAASWFLP